MSDAPTPTPRAELPDLPFRRYRAVPEPVTAVQLQEPEDVPNPFGAGGTYHGEPGAWKVTYRERADGTRDVAVVSAEHFAKTYEQMGGDQYRKKVTAEVEAARLSAPLDIVTTEGPAHGEPGDWLILLDSGAYFNDDEYFRAHYAPAD